MAGNSEFELIQDYSWRAGLNNLLKAEFGRWWKTNTWWKQSLIWISVIDLLVITIIFAESSEGNAVLREELLLLYGIFGGMFVLIGVIIMMQGAIVGEKMAGTAAWVLSKPVSRAAFVISKLFSNAFGVAITAILIPGIVAYFAITQIANIDLSPGNFLAGMGIIFLSTLFWLVLTLTLGAFYSSRGPVIGIPMALVFGQQFLRGLIPWLGNLIPYELVIPGNDGNSVVGAVLAGVAPPSWAPVYSALVLIFLLTAVSIWRFGREEF